MLNPIGSLFREAWRHYTARFSALMEIVLVPVLIIVLAYVLLFIGSFFAVAGGLLLIVGWVAFVFATIALITSIDQGTGVDDSYRAAFPLFWSFLWLGILAVFAVLGGFVMLVIPGFWFGVSLSFGTYIFVVERRRGLDALRQSKKYVKGYWWACFGRSILLSVILWVIAVVVQVPIALIAGRLAALIVYLFIISLFIPFSITYQYLIYRNLRQLKPELADAHAEEGGGFIMASAIVGVVAAALILAAIIFFAGTGVFAQLRAMHQMGPGSDQGYYMPMQPYGPQQGP